MITLFLATVIGWYLVIMGLFLLFRQEHTKAIAAEVMGQRGLLMIMGVFTLILGLLMVVSHNVWMMGWPVIITVFSWMVLLSGLMRLFFPDTAIRLGRTFLNDPMKMRLSAAISLIIGLFLLYHVYAYLLSSIGL